MSRSRSSVRASAFTLLELMIVIAIMAVVMTMGVPMVYKIFHREALRQAVSDVIEVCSNARAQAILKGTMTEVIWHPKDGRLEVAGAAPAPEAAASDGGVLDVSTTHPAGSGMSAQISDSVAIDMLDVNLTEYKEAEQARVRFYPNGMCDEMILILRRIDGGEQRGVTLEISTSLASVLNEQDLQNLRNGRL
jgi:prepilin-type N-terminal cleavage/methylation domain-containing protein